jgi:hypothetical protein
MYGMLEHEISRRHREEIRQEVAAYRLEKTAREPRRRVPSDGGHEVGARAIRGAFQDAPHEPQIARTRAVCERPSRRKRTEENEMYGFGEHEGLGQTKVEIPREVAAGHPAKTEDAYREPGPYVVRDLSWELARYLETQFFPESASAASDGASRRHGWTRDEERLAG